MMTSFAHRPTLRAAVTGLSVSVTALWLCACQPKSATQAVVSPEPAASAPVTASAIAQSTPASTATTTSTNADIEQKLAANLAKSGIDAKVTSVTPTAMPSLYWVKAEGLPAFFTDNTGQYIVQGDIVKVGGDAPEPISANLAAADTKVALAALDPNDMVIFKPKGETRAVIYVFTDADCGYCRKLHSEIDRINALGIEVRYLPWPRSEQTMPIMEAIWCSPDRNQALTAAKQGLPVNAPACDNPVRRIQQLGLDLGVSGTPAIFDANGHQLGGYMPPEQLARALGLS